MEAAWDACRQVFGIAAVARAVPCEKTVDAIVEAARTYLADAFAVAKSFKVESKRADKMFPMNSIQLSQAVGGDLAELFPHVAVDRVHLRNSVVNYDTSLLCFVITPSRALSAFYHPPADRKSTRLNSSHRSLSRMPSSA